jgi:transposase
LRIIKPNKEISMNTKKKQSPDSIVREIKRKTRRKFTAEEKIRIILEGLKGEESIADLCRKEGIHPTMYYKWSKAFLEGGKRRLTGDTIREAGSEEVNEMRSENEDLKQLVAELSLKNRVLKKTLQGLE